MLPLDDARWQDLKNGYRLRYDARPLLERFAHGRNSGACWTELWNELHHQDDVDTAAYAAFPYLVRIAANRTRDWNIYLFAATLLSLAGADDNPPVPQLLEPGFRTASLELFELATADLRAGAPSAQVRSIIAFLAAYAGARALSLAIMDIDLFEGYGEGVLEAEAHGNN